MCVCVCVCACARACVRACVRVCDVRKHYRAASTLCVRVQLMERVQEKNIVRMKSDPNFQTTPAPHDVIESEHH